MDRKDTVALAKLRGLMASGEAREIRLAAGLSLGEAGAAVGTAAATIHRWENLQRKPHGDVAVRYARLLQLLGSVNA